MKDKIKNLAVKWNCTDGKKLLCICYAVCIIMTVAAHALIGIIHIAAYKTGYYQEKSLSVNDFEPVGAEIIDDMTIINATNDTQLIYSGNVKNLYIKCEFSQNPGEVVLFYSRNNDYAFGTHQMLYARIEDGYYVFRMPFGVKQFRLDTGVEPPITVNFEEITLNKSTLTEMVNFRMSEVFWIAVLPAIIYCTLDTVCSYINIGKQKKKIH